MARKIDLSETDINQILNDNLTIKYWEFQLGVGYVYEYAPDNVHYSAPYPEYGNKLWKRIESGILNFLCSNEQPQEWVNELITGDIRNLIVGLTSAITSKYDISMGIAIPITALVVKTGVVSFCKNQKIKNKVDIDIKCIVKNRELNNE